MKKKSAQATVVVEGVVRVAVKSHINLLQIKSNARDVESQAFQELRFKDDGSHHNELRRFVHIVTEGNADLHACTEKETAHAEGCAGYFICNS